MIHYSTHYSAIFSHEYSDTKNMSCASNPLYNFLLASLSLFTVHCSASTLCGQELGLEADGSLDLALPNATVLAAVLRY